MNWKELGLKVGLEIHWELNTKHKLFCECPTVLRNDKPDVLIERYMRAVAGELGSVDVAAEFEALKGKKLIYETYSDTNCLVETDSEPPHNPNPEAVETALMIGLLLNAKPVDEIHVMRKTIIDGSNVSGFQRTMLVARYGFVDTSSGKVGIENISLEEDSARIIENKSGRVVFRLDRLGIPEVEIGTSPDIHTPEQALETAKTIGDIVMSTGRVKTGLGVVRQDVNVSIKKGNRTEIKHVQRLGQIPVVIENEVRRQLKLIKQKKKVGREVRVANGDGTTRFLRPLAGAMRLYPETDVEPIRLTFEIITNTRKNLPELWSEKRKRFKAMGLSEELGRGIIRSKYLDLFEKSCKMFELNKNIIANVFVNTLKDLRNNENILVERLKGQDFFGLFKLLEKKKIAKESIPDILRYKTKNPGVSVERIVDKLQLKVLSEKELRKEIREIIKKNSGLPIGKIIGMVMSRFRGKARSEDVVRIVKEEVRKG